MTFNPQALSPDTLPIVPSIVWLGFSLVIFITSMIFIAVMKRFQSPENKNSAFKMVLLFLGDVIKKPFLLFLVGYTIFVAISGTVIYTPKLPAHYQVFLLSVAVYIRKITEFLAFFWLVINALNKGEIQLESWLIKNNKKIPSILLPMLSTSLKAALLFLMLNILIPALGIVGPANEVFAKMAKVSLIGILAWLFVELLNGIEKLILNQYAYTEEHADLSRKINTQVLLLKKVILIIVGVVTLASILMVFDSVKNLGAGLLTTAGVISAIGAFASQQSLGRIFSGLQIAFTQPLRIGDTVIIDSEQGTVEEITLSYIVVKLWDLRRLIVPSDYFTNRGLQNLSRTSTDLLGIVYFYADYQLPLAPVRAEFNRILQNSKLWNAKVSNLQMTDIKDYGIELRALVSAKDSSTLWDLRCEVREKLMEFININFPQYLPKTRNISWKSEDATPEPAEHG
jgi:small-conductance mechanosensitive channel